MVSVVVQGTTMLPDDVEAQIDMVLTKLMPQRLEEMTEEEFKTYKEGMVKQLQEPPKGFSDEVNFYWPLVASNGQCFDKRMDELEYLEKSLKTKEQLIAAWKFAVLPENGSMRPRVVVKYFSQKD